jgi:glycosyltransferase involved in cell wall biosynthesis
VIETSSRISIVVPIYNEVDNIESLAKSIQAALSEVPWPWELIFIDDGSDDGSGQRLKETAQGVGPHCRVVELQRNFGQTAALQAGIDVARGDVVVTLDGDLQNDPADIPRMVERLLDEDLDLLTGWRKSRRDNLWLRTIPSNVANWLIGRITGVRLHDYGCSLKVYRMSVVRSIRLYGEMHRFIPAWLTANTSVARIKEEVVTHHPRRHGRSKYGLSRIYRVLLDLLTVFFFMRFVSRPGHFFGRIGLGLGLIGAAILTYLVCVKLFLGEDIGTRPLLMAGVLLVLVAVQLFTTGILGEMVTRVYFESSGSKPYVIRNAAAQADADTRAGWSTPRGSR